MNEELRTSSGGRSPAHPSARTAIRGALGWLVAGAAVLAVCGFFSHDNRPTLAVAARPTAAPVVAVSFDEAVEHMKAASNAPRPDAVPATAASPEERNRAMGLLARTDRVLRDYARKFGEFPVGSNADITRVLAGDNLNRIVFVTSDELPMSPAGELIDGWGTPYFFHQISGSRMELFSAGPDRQMFTADDLKILAN